MAEDCSDQDAGVKRPGNAQLLDPCRFNVGQDEVSSTYLNCADAALVGRPGCPAVLNLSHFEETVVLQKLFDVRVVVGARVTHEIEGPYVLRLVDDSGEDHSVGASGGRPSEGDATTSVLLSCCRLALRGFYVMGPNLSLAFWKMAVMSVSSEMMKGGGAQGAWYV